MNPKIKQQIDEEALRRFPIDKAMDASFKIIDFNESDRLKFIQAAEYGYNIKESVNEKRYSDEEVKELMFETYLNTPKYVNPHAISIWIDSRVSASNQENNEGENAVLVEDKIDEIIGGYECIDIAPDDEPHYHKEDVREMLRNLINPPKEK